MAALGYSEGEAASTAARLRAQVMQSAERIAAVLLPRESAAAESMVPAGAPLACTRRLSALLEALIARGRGFELRLEEMQKELERGQEAIWSLKQLLDSAEKGNGAALTHVRR